VNRRDLLILGAGTTIAWPFIALAQQKDMPIIGYLSTGSSSPNAANVAAFRDGLSETGYAEGKNVAIEYLWAEGIYAGLPALAAKLVDHKVDVIAAMGGNPSPLAAKSATSTIPIVFTASDAVGVGLVASLARPGGNATGIDIMAIELMPKRLELLSELVPQARVIALLVNPNNPLAERQTREVQEAPGAKGVQLLTLKASTENEIDAAFAYLVQQHTGALIIGSDPFFGNQRGQLVALAARHAVPAIHFFREFVTAGGLISYGTSLPAVSHQAGIYVGKILKGAKPADLPVEQPTKFELVINLKTAKTLGLTVPPSILARADEVIE
jgi:putative ABC transport system substrate-binding protein